MEILSEARLFGMKCASTPLEPYHNLAKATSDYFDKPNRYRRLVDKLIYSTLIHPELAYSIHTLAQFMHQPRQEH